MRTARRPGRPLRRTAWALLCALAVTTALGVRGATATGRVGTGGAWTTYGQSPARDAAQTASPPLLPIHRLWRTGGLDGAIYGQPLLYAGRVYVATEANVVYALDARTGQIAWSTRLGTPVPSGALPCGNIAPTVGVTSTMLLDPALGRLFVSAATERSGRVHHVLVGLTLAGRRIFARDLDRPGWDAAAQLQRAALALDRGRVLVGFGGNYGDCGNYHGVLVSLAESGRGPALAYQVPTAFGGAIWAPGGVAVEPSGAIVLATGNSRGTATFDGGDGVLELSPGLRRRSFFAPRSFARDNAEDLDLGSTAPLLLPGGRVFAIGKAGVAYLLDAHDLGGVGGARDARSVCYSAGASAYSAGAVFVTCPQGALTALGVRGGHLATLWRAAVAGTGSPTVAGGALWSIGADTLYGLSTRTGRVLQAVPVIPTEHFAAPAAGDGLLVVAGAGALEAFAGPRGIVG